MSDRAEFDEAVRAVDWGGLQSTYGPGDVVGEIVRALGSSEEATVVEAWRLFQETHLQHQGTVYPATAVAAPFLADLALDSETLFRPALIVELALMATGYDTPYSPEGTARAVRDAMRRRVPRFAGQWETADRALDAALTVLSLAFPVESTALVDGIRRWFDQSSGSVRHGLGLALVYHGLSNAHTEQIRREEIGNSLGWVAQCGELSIYRPRLPSGLPRPDEEPVFDSSLMAAVYAAQNLRAGAIERKEDISSFSELQGTFLERMYSLIPYPPV